MIARSMHVLHVLPHLDPAFGGPTHALVGLASAQHRQGMQVTVATSFVEGYDDSKVRLLRDLGVEVIEIGPVKGPLGMHASMKPKLEAALRPAQVCHIHAVWEQIQHTAATLARRLAKPHIFRPCGMLDPWCLNQSRIKKKLYMMLRLRKNLNRCSLIHFTTATERDLVAPLGFRAPTVVESNGVDLAEYETLPEPGLFRRAHNIAVDQPVVIFMSRLHHKKGLELLIPAFAQLRHSDAALVLAGPDDRGYRTKVEAMIAQYGLQDRVHLVGMLQGEMKHAALADADVFVLPSYQENFGVVVVEALAARTPVVISDQVNIHQEITAGHVGGVVPTEIEPLAHELDLWLDDDAVRQAASDRAWEFVRTRYDWAEIAGRWQDRYEKLAAGELPGDARSAAVE